MSNAPPPEDPDVPAPTEPEPDRETEPVEAPDVVAVALIAPASSIEAIDTGTGQVLPAEEPQLVALRDESPPEPPPVPDEDRLAPVLEALDRLRDELGGKVDRLQGQFDRELRAESSREKVVDRLHAELQEYKNDLLLKITRPIFVDLIQLHDDLGKMADTLDDPKAIGVLRDTQQGIEDVLYRQGVEPYSAEEDTFDPRRQRAVTTLATDLPERNKKVAARLRPGFTLGDKVIRPELVSVFALKRPPADGGGDAPADA